jgi:oxygen-dependent protoporphyrinogen oxidase
MKIAILGGGLAGVTAAYELARLRERGAPIDATLFEASGRLGGIIETVHANGFIIECGPEAWVTEKPWARELAEELGLAMQPSLDAQRRTWLMGKDKKLAAMPDGMRLMVPADLAAIDNSPLLSEAAKRAYREEPSRAGELHASAPAFDGPDESIASFVRRHFGDEVARTFAAPLLAGVFGGDIETLSARAVMPALVAMEREHGSLITALAKSSAKTAVPVFTTLRDGMGTLIDAMTAKLTDVRLQTPVTGLERNGTRWRVDQSEEFDAVILATPAHVTRTLLQPHDAVAADLLPREASSAAIVALGFTEKLALPAGFGFLALPEANSPLLACTFTHQKFAGRVPTGSSMLRAFFSGEQWMNSSDDDLIALAHSELSAILGPLPAPQIKITRRMPHSLPQYSIGHVARIAALHARMPQGLRLIGNAYTGVGIPDLIREARRAAHASHTVLKRAEG